MAGRKTRCRYSTAARDPQTVHGKQSRDLVQKYPSLLGVSKCPWKVHITVNLGMDFSLFCSQMYLYFHLLKLPECVENQTSAIFGLCHIDFFTALPTVRKDCLDCKVVIVVMRGLVAEGGRSACLLHRGRTAVPLDLRNPFFHRVVVSAWSAACNISSCLVS